MNSETLIKLSDIYKNKVKQIEMKLKSNYFIPTPKINPSSIKINAYDDMFYEMYFKQKYFNKFSNEILNIDLKISGDIIKDLKHLLKRFDRLFLHDINFKISKFQDKFNYFSPADENEIYLYNSMNMETYQQTEFRKQLWNIEDLIHKKLLSFYKEYKINISFYEDEKFDMVWIIFKIIRF